MPAQQYRYQIVVRGRLGGLHRTAVEGFTVEPDGPDTMLVGSVDQATLYRSLDRLHSVGVELVGLRRLDTDPG